MGKVLKRCNRTNFLKMYCNVETFSVRKCKTDCTSSEGATEELNVKK